MRMLYFGLLLVLGLSTNAFGIPNSDSKQIPSSCPTASELYYYYQPILNTSGSLTGFRVFVCKRTSYSATNVQVGLSIQGITWTGASNVIGATVTIPANSTCASVDIIDFSQITCIEITSIICAGSDCLTLNDFDHSVAPIEDGAGGIVNWGLTVWKIPFFNRCDVVVVYRMTGISASGDIIVTNVSLTIKANTTWGFKHFGYTWQQVLSAELLSVTCVNCISGRIMTSPKSEKIPEVLQPKFPITIFPNPVSDEMILNLDLKDSEPLTLILTDLNGRNVHRRQINVSKGQSQVRENLSSLIDGVYVLRVLRKDKIVFLQKIVVAK